MKKLFILVILLQVNVWSGEKSIEEINQALNYDLFDVNGEINYKKIIEEYAIELCGEVNLFGNRKYYEWRSYVGEYIEPKNIFNQTAYDIFIYEKDDKLSNMYITLYRLDNGLDSIDFKNNKHYNRLKTRGAFFDYIVDYFGKTFTGLFGKTTKIQEGNSIFSYTWFYKNYKIGVQYPTNRKYICLTFSDMKNQVEIKSNYKEELKNHVIQNKFGDIQLKSIFISNQLNEGHCGAYSYVMMMSYLGLEFNVRKEAYLFYEHGNYHSTKRSKRGISIGDNSLRKIVNSFQTVKKNIDNGFPIWFSHNVGMNNDRRYVEYNENREKAQRNGHWKRWTIDAPKYIPKMEVGRESLHASLIIGYNEFTQEVLVAESWGKEHGAYWYPFWTFINVINEIYSFN